jgi:predicted N-formylglutamate amidohydrolase
MALRLRPSKDPKHEMAVLAKISETLLGSSDPDPVEFVNRSGRGDFLLVCEHAGRLIPAALGDLGLPASEMNRHIASDIGAEGLSRNLSARLDAPLVMQRYSRLVIDCNRPLGAPDCIPETSDGTAVPANSRLAEAERLRRYDEIHRPFHEAIDAMLDARQHAGRRTFLVTVHSFTPRLAGLDRPWLLGLLHNRDSCFARRMMDAFVSINPKVAAGHNQPYTVDDLSDFTIPVHGERRKLPHVLIEVRNDQLGDEPGQKHWAHLLAGALETAARSTAGESQLHGV